MIEQDFSRREFIKVSLLAGGGFLVGCSLLPGRNENLRDPAAADSVTHGGQKLSVWIRFAADGRFTFILDRTEMGQGVLTALATLVAEELSLNPADLRIEFAPVHTDYTNPAFASQVTGGSTSVGMAWGPLRKAAAEVREIILRQGAQLLHDQNKKGFSVLNIHKIKEQYSYSPQGVKNISGQVISLASIAQGMKNLEWPFDAKVKEKKDFTLIGKSIPRLDLKQKVMGKAMFGIDVDAYHSLNGERFPQLAEMIIGVTVRSPWRGGLPVFKQPEFEAYREKNSDVVIFPITSGVGVVASNFWRAKQVGQELLRLSLVSFEMGGVEKWTRNPTWTHQDYKKSLKNAALQRNGYLVEQNGLDLAANLPLVLHTKTVEATYEVPYLPHATMEPQNCTALVTAQSCELWVPTQIPGACREAAASALGLSQDQVTVHTTYVGGGFGRRLINDFVLDAVEMSKRVGKPVKVIWTRENDFQHDFYRPASAGFLQAGLNDKGDILFWRHQIAAPSIASYFLKEYASSAIPKWVPTKFIDKIGSNLNNLLKKPWPAKFDITTLEWAVSAPYDFGLKKEVTYKHHSSALPIGFWRSVGASSNCFIVECFLDEVAQAVGKDPLEYRKILLKSAARKPSSEKTGPTSKPFPLKIFGNPVFAQPDAARCLNLLELAESKWTPISGAHRGVANSFCFASHCTQIVDVSFDKTTRKLTVHRVIAAVDAGHIVNPDIVRQQIEGGIIFALSAALKQEITVSDKGVEQSNFHDSEILRLFETPKIEVYMVGIDVDWPKTVKRDKDGIVPPTGIGETGVPATAPALVNAIFAATGQRLRSLPVRL